MGHLEAKLNRIVYISQSKPNILEEQTLGGHNLYNCLCGLLSLLRGKCPVFPIYKLDGHANRTSQKVMAYRSMVSKNKNKTPKLCQTSEITISRQSILPLV